MIQGNYKSLIEKLIAKTNKKEAIWSKTSSENEFKLDLGKGAITVDSYWSDSKRYIDMRIINDKGDIIDSIEFTVRDEEDYQSLYELHILARRSYYKLDETIMYIVKELDNDKIIGNESPKSSDDLPF